MLSLAAYTVIHVVISLMGIASGFVVLSGLLGGKRMDGWTAVFLFTTLLTSVTGFGFPFTQLLPSHIVGLISLVVLVPAFLARYTFRLAGGWRGTYVVSAVTALYLNVFVLIVQLFLKVPVLNALAPTQSELPFVVAQTAALLLFIALGARAATRFRPRLA